jgi:cystathionine beta-lyase
MDSISTKYDFDTVTDRRETNSIKWSRYGPDVLPLWVADMDFPAPPNVQAALKKAVTHGIFGYEAPSLSLKKKVADRMERLYGWQVDPEMVVATPGVIAGFNTAARAACRAGEGILVQPPVYPPFFGVHSWAGLVHQENPLQETLNEKRVQYSLDMETFRQGLNQGQVHTAMFLLCSPHNPTGQVYGRQTLMDMADACLANGTVICSDEIHSELLLGDSTHIPLASVSPEIAQRSVSLVAPSKTFNVAGLNCAFAIIPDPGLRQEFKKIMESLSMHVNSLGLVAAEAAYSGDCDEWLAELKVYLTANRDYLVSFIDQYMDGMRVVIPQATYLAWLDCRELVASGRMKGNPHEFFLDQAKVAVNDGCTFGTGGEGFVRLNFGCPRITLENALKRMKQAME